MTSVASDYLAKALQVENKIVTFRLLSRELSINVNVAKNELAAFYRACRASSQPVYATYLVSGEVSSAPLRTGDDMDVDEDDVQYQSRRIVVVPEEELEAISCQFSKAPSVHFYSLSPSPIKDTALLVTPTEQVRSIDISRGPEHAKLVGSIVNDLSTWPKPVAKGKGKEKPGSKVFPAESKKAEASKESKPAAKPKEKEQHEPKLRQKAEEKKKTGTLDWSKAAIKKEESKQTGPRGTKRPSPASDTEAAPAPVAAKPVNARKSFPPANPLRPAPTSTTTRKAHETEEEEEEEEEEKKPSAPSTSSKNLLTGTSSTIKVRKGVLISDSEEEEIPVVSKSKKVSRHAPIDSVADAPAKSRSGKATSTRSGADSDRSTRAIMDIDDDESAPDASESEPEHVPLNKSESRNVPKKPKEKEPMGIEKGSKNPKPKTKKKVPLGKNGRPKKRVVKSRMSTDAKGYMAMEDYSSYESVSGSDVEANTVTDREDSMAIDESDTAKSTTKARPRPRKSGAQDDAKTKNVEVSKKASASTAVKAQPSIKPSKTLKRQDSASTEDQKQSDVEQKSTTKAKAEDTKAKSGTGAKPGQQKLMSFFGKK